jgi:hypothetical protein
MLIALGRKALRATGLDLTLSVGALGAATAHAAVSVVETLDVASHPVLLAVVVAVGLASDDHQAATPGVAGAEL